MTKSKAQNKFKIQNSKPKFCHLRFDLWYYFVICALTFGFLNCAYALNLDQVKIDFLKGNYKAAIAEGERILPSAGHTADTDELYYLLGLSYLKDGNYPRAAEMFEIILKEFKSSKLKEEAKLGLADTYYLRENYASAQVIYQEMLKDSPNSKFKWIIDRRLSKISSPQANTVVQAEEFYTVQVGCFQNYTNARNLEQELVRKGYPVYIEEYFQGAKQYRVRVGKIQKREEVVKLQERLSRAGYPTKIFP